MNRLWGPGGKDWLDDTRMAAAFEDRLRSLRRLIKTYDNEIVRLDARIAGVFKGHPGYETIQQIHGVGPVCAAIFVVEIGDVTRFDNARQISSWAGMTHVRSEQRILTISSKAGMKRPLFSRHSAKASVRTLPRRKPLTLCHRVRLPVREKSRNRSSD